MRLIVRPTRQKSRKNKFQVNFTDVFSFPLIVSLFTRPNNREVDLQLCSFYITTRQLI